MAPFSNKLMYPIYENEKIEFRGTTFKRFWLKKRRLLVIYQNIPELQFSFFLESLSNMHRNILYYSAEMLKIANSL